MDQNKQRVLMVHNFYQIGGGEHTVFENEKRLIQDNGHTLIEYTRSNDEIKTSKLKRALLPFTTIYSFKTYREVKKLITEEKIDVVHCHNTFPLISPSVYYAALKCGVPVIQTIHNFRFLCPCGIFYRDGEICEECMTIGLKQSLKHKCYRNSVIQTAVVTSMLKIHRWIGTYQKIHYIFLTEFNRNKFRYLIGSKAENEFVKPNFEYIDIQPAETKDINKDKYIFIGRFDEAKGIRFLLNAWKEISDKKLVIYGSGPLEQLVKDAAKANPNIEYRGFCKQEIIFENLKVASALIFTSEWYETFGMTIIESFASGSPVLCSDIGNAADIVKYANAGICYKNKSVADFLKKLEDISKEQTNRELRKRARKAYEENYSPDVNYYMLKNIYDRVCNKNG